MAGITKAEREARAAAAAAAAAEQGGDQPRDTAEGTTQDAEAHQPDQAGGVELVRMVRDADTWPAPHDAEVHPDEISNYVAGGWRLAED